MADAREVILGRIREALADRPARRPVPRDYDHARVIDDPIALFHERAADYRAVVRRVAAGGLPDAIAAALAARGARKLVVPADLPSWWRAGEVVWSMDAPASPLSVAALDRADGVLTGCAVAIAETGTIVLDGGVAQGRRALTLVPDYHLCVVRADQIAGTVPEALARLTPTNPLTFISGPSATSDIELDRVEGVHGPRALEILIAT